MAIVGTVCCGLAWVGSVYHHYEYVRPPLYDAFRAELARPEDLERRLLKLPQAERDALAVSQMRLLWNPDLLFTNDYERALAVFLPITSDASRKELIEITDWQVPSAFYLMEWEAVLAKTRKLNPEGVASLEKLLQELSTTLVHRAENGDRHALSSLHTVPARLWSAGAKEGFAKLAVEIRGNLEKPGLSVAVRAVALGPNPERELTQLFLHNSQSIDLDELDDANGFRRVYGLSELDRGKVFDFLVGATAFDSPRNQLRFLWQLDKEKTRFAEWFKKLSERKSGYRGIDLIFFYPPQNENRDKLLDYMAQIGLGLSDRSDLSALHDDLFSLRNFLTHGFSVSSTDWSTPGAQHFLRHVDRTTTALYRDMGDPPLINPTVDQKQVLDELREILQFIDQKKLQGQSSR